VTPAPTHDQSFQISLALRDGYEMSADFGLPGVEPLLFDEPAPLGAGNGPNAARVLAAAVGNCLAASLLFCLRKARVDVQELRATVTGTMARTERGRLRITGLRVRLEPVVPADQHDRMARCVELYEDFCLVSQSVRQGIAITADVHPADAAEPAAV
jgi:organic hydroperoxide reductase OsmC/OhrA